ncbi:unnamed protein product [Acanthoscelides obtectus]|uniref:Uncharacterized protein n=1 Tax=Acanthoscelides obtectus TaxID=200917 RepID=A0A9P0KAM6_ACAOB|nr:unnamed protein product [Acanthoscelides obtectus]CAK1633452.1 hypothetical protein AOBTE_LOCUS8147 [Acanthoscelides obtectus]
MAEELAKPLGAIASILENLQGKVDDSGTQFSAPVIQKTPISLALLSFDPDSTDSHVWLQKIEGYKNEFGWSDRETSSLHN